MAGRRSTDRILAQAQRAIEQDQLENARVLLEAAARQDAADARPWLLLAGIATSARERRSFLAQADRLKTAPPAPAPLPGGPVRVVAQPVPLAPATVAYPAPTAARSRGALGRAGLIVAVLLALVAGGYLFSQTPTGQSLLRGIFEQPVAVVEAAPDAGLPADATVPAEAVTEVAASPASEDALPTPTLAVNLAAGSTDALAPSADAATQEAPPGDEPAAEPPLLPEKQVDAAGQPLGTWTPTAEPTPTLAPTATPTATPEPTATLEPPPPGSPRPLGVGPAEKWIDVNLTTQTLTAYEGDTLVMTTLISSGRWEYQTVTGEFRTYLKYDMQTMSGYHLGLDYVTTDVPNVMYFFRDFAIHGAYWHNSFGTPVSHGCVNAPPADAAWLYAWAPVGTFVTVHY
jgi:lipoprotein-anchoring transpeptidase ErfK/SrfK